MQPNALPNRREMYAMQAMCAERGMQRPLPACA